MVLNQGCRVGPGCFSQACYIRHACVTSPRNSEAEEEKGSVGEREKSREKQTLVVGRGVNTEKLLEWGMVGEILTLSSNDDH